MKGPAVAHDERFWALIARAGPDLRMARVAMSLQALPEPEVRDFFRRVQRATSALDTQHHRLYALLAREHPLEDAGTYVDSSRQQPEASADGWAEFDDVVLTVVALGYDVWCAVLHGACLLAASWPTELGRALIATLSTEDPV